MPRVIYSLIFDLRTLGGSTLQLVVPLDTTGQSPHCRAVSSKQRVVDLRIWDLVRHGREVYEISAVRAYREATWRVEAARMAQGYEIKEAE